MFGEVKRERSGWRDQWPSQVQKTFGFDLPMFDLDSVLTTGSTLDDTHGWPVVQYDREKAVAFIEYKSVGADLSKGASALRTLVDIADNYRDGRPCFLVIYNREEEWFEVRPKNVHARKFVKRDRMRLTIREFYYLQCQLRGRKPEKEIAANLSHRNSVLKKILEQKAA